MKDCKAVFFLNNKVLQLKKTKRTVFHHLGGRGKKNVDACLACTLGYGRSKKKIMPWDGVEWAGRDWGD